MLSTTQIERDVVLDQPAGQPAACKKWKYVPTPETDQRIRNAYFKLRNGDRSALKSAAHAIGWPKYAISKRAAELGLARTKEKPWSAEEEEILFASGHLPWSSVQRRLAAAGFSRSCAAIAVKMTRMRVKSNLDGYSAHSLAVAFGVDVHKVLTWIRGGLLIAERRGTARTAAQGGDSWWITHKNVKRFVLKAPEEIDLYRVEKFWFLDLLTDGKICR